MSLRGQGGTCAPFSTRLTVLSQDFITATSRHTPLLTAVADSSCRWVVRTPRHVVQRGMSAESGETLPSHLQQLDGLLVRALDRLQRQMLVDFEAFLARVSR
jgi:hypothetical protein